MSLIGLLTATEKQVHLGRLHMGPIQWHLKNSRRVPESLEKVLPVPRSLHPHLQWFLKESNVLQGQPLHPLKHALQIFTDASKEGWGAHLNKHTARGDQVVFLDPRPLFEQHSFGGHRQHYSGCLYKQRRGNEVGPSKLDSRLGQTIQTEWSLHPEVFHEICSQWHQPQVDLFPPGSTTNCQFVSPVSDPQAWAVDTLSLSWEDLDPYTFPPAAILDKVAGPPMQQNHTDSAGVAQHALVLGPSGHVQSDPTVPAQSAQSCDSTIQPDPAQKSVKPEPTCLAPRTTPIKEQGFSEAVAAEIEAPQRGSTRSICEAKWTIFTKWCISNQVDFRTPPSPKMRRCVHM